MDHVRRDELKLVGQVVSHYKILAPLGEGGMGVVYLAEHTRLGGQAVLKFLPRSLTRDEDARRRFIHEAQAASAVNDQHICTVYDIDEAPDGSTFIAMAYCEGENLRQVISRGPLPVDRAVDVALQIASGVEKVHRLGIVHRDLKPANVMVAPDGFVRIVDFGLAKLTGRTQVTRSGATVGTAAYMAPEQVRGEDVDRRADIWALGVVLCEMVTGRRLFEGDFEQAVFYQIVHEDPDLVGVPTSVLPIVRKCLQRDPQLRYESMSALAADLRRIGSPGQRGSASWRPVAVPQRAAIGGSVLLLIALTAIFLAPSNRTALLGWFGANPMPDARHVAVLPFRNVSGDATGDAYCSGLMETLTSKLAHLEQFSGEKFWVVPAGDVLKRSVQSAEEARRIFGANLVIDGSFHRQDDAVRLTLNLIDADTRFVLASEVIDRASADAIALQDEAIIRVAEMLRMEIPEAADRMFRAGGTMIPGAEEYYLQGRGHLNDYQKTGNVDLAIGLFERALEKDSTYALAHAGLAEGYWQKYRSTKNVRWVDLAVAHSETALRLDDMLAAAHVMLGTTHTETGEYDEALRAFQRALELDPYSAEAYRGRSKALEAEGDLSGAEEALKKSISLKPGYWAGYNTLGAFYIRHGQYELAAKQFEIVISLTPQNASGFNNAGGAYLALGESDRALGMLERSVQLEPRVSVYSNLGWHYFFQMKYAEAARSYERALELDDSDHKIWAYLAESYYWAPGERQKARETYEEALKRAESQLTVNDKDPDLTVRLAHYHAVLGNPELARRFLTRTIELNPNEAEIFLRIGDTYERLGSRSEALDWIEKSLDAGLPVIHVENAPSLNDLRKDSRYQSILSIISIP